MTGFFDWHRWWKIQRAASRRFARHAHYPAKIRWARYERLMTYARHCLETYQEQPS